MKCRLFSVLFCRWWAGWLCKTRYPHEWSITIDWRMWGLWLVSYIHMYMCFLGLCNVFPKKNIHMTHDTAHKIMNIEYNGACVLYTNANNSLACPQSKPPWRDENIALNTMASVRFWASLISHIPANLFSTRAASTAFNGKHEEENKGKTAQLSGPASNWIITGVASNGLHSQYIIM